MYMGIQRKNIFYINSIKQLTTDKYCYILFISNG